MIAFAEVVITYPLKKVLGVSAAGATGAIGPSFSCFRQTINSPSASLSLLLCCCSDRQASSQARQG